MDKLLNEILKTQSVTFNTKSMRKLIKRYAGYFGCTILNDKGNIYCTKGMAEIYPCVIAHTDTVHKIIKHEDFQVLSSGEMVFGFDKSLKDFSGIGGDDKVGIYIALCALRDFDSCKAVFFRDEEIGCAGSDEALMDFFTDCSFVLMCDRKGNKDMVHSICGEMLTSKEFDDAICPVISQYGYSFCEGMLTDVYQLRFNGLDICSVNMSCGYYNPHCKDEYINLADMNNCKDMVYDLIKQFSHTQWKHEVVEDYYGHYADFYDTPKHTHNEIAGERCIFCGDYNLQFDREVMDYYCHICRAYQMIDCPEFEDMNSGAKDSVYCGKFSDSSRYSFTKKEFPS